MTERRIYGVLFVVHFMEFPKPNHIWDFVRQKKETKMQCTDVYAPNWKWIYRLNNAIIFSTKKKEEETGDYHIIENKWITYEAEMNCACFHMFSTQRMRHIIRMEREINSKIDPFRYTFIYFWFNTNLCCATLNAVLLIAIFAPWNYTHF